MGAWEQMYNSDFNLTEFRKIKNGLDYIDRKAPDDRITLVCILNTKILMSDSIENKKEYCLFIDELGTANVNDVKSNFYILAGCSIDKEDRQKMKIRADQIKFKYWGDTNIVFHSREIGRKENAFEILKDKKVLNEFLMDLEQFLLHAKFKMFFVILDKEKARKKAWNHIKIYKETSDKIVRNFILILLTGDSRGKIIVESATAEKDFYFHRALGYYLTAGLKGLRVDYKKIQETVTSISFVTKNNFDIEEQIADLFAYAAKCKYLKMTGGKFKEGVYEKMILGLLEKKIFKKPQNAGERKMKYFNEANSFTILPQ